MKTHWPTSARINREPSVIPDGRSLVLAEVMSLVSRFHGEYVHSRRVRVLRDYLAQLIPHCSHVLDVGCGDGRLSRLIARERLDIQITGIDVFVREQTEIPVHGFDGQTIPYPDKNFDVVLLVDVLHHTDNPMALLREAVRVARQAMIIKDHTRNGLLAGPTLRFMDWVGNARHGVTLPYNYWPRKRWFEAFNMLQLSVDRWEADLKLYPRPASWVFDRSLHFIARLDLSRTAAA